MLNRNSIIPLNLSRLIITHHRLNKPIPDEVYNDYGLSSGIFQEWFIPCVFCPPVSSAITEVVKCEHERAVHLFVDSLVNQDKPSFAFQCTDSNRFKKGICLSCRKNRCNSIGYNTKKMRKKRNSKMYLKTRAGMPFRGNLPSCS